jgi:hypothetical protein
MHICFPYSENFIQQVQDYILRYEPFYTAIWSTVPFGTTKKIHRKAIHTPIEGRHPRLAESIKKMTRWIGYNDKASADYFDKYFQDRHLQTRLVKNTDHTEALKLLSTTEYGINLVYADYKARLAEMIGMDYELAKEWNRDYNKLYRELDIVTRFQKFVHDPPNGVIGGHCVTQNAHILLKQFPNIMLDLIIDMEQK